MKRILLLLTLLVSTLTSFSQNAPIAVDDTVYIPNHIIVNQDTADIDLVQLRNNDYDVDGDYFGIDTILYGGSNTLITEYLNGNLTKLKFYTGYVLSTHDTFRYVLKEFQALNLKDTATVIIEVMRKSHEILDANNIRATIDKYVLFTNQAYGIPGFEAPKNSGLHSIFASNLWVIGENGNKIYGNVRKFGGQYSAGNGQFLSSNGPVSNVSHTDSLMNTTWDRVWKVYQHQIDFHINNWNGPGYTLIQNIADWPAHGDTVLGEEFYLAPFYDHNNDGLYNPLSGDYPLIKGDQAIYFIYNDGFAQMLVEPMKAEVHGMAYAYQCMDSALRNTIFVDYTIYNRSNKTYDSTYFGMWSDMDVGNAQDDYVQCDVDRGLFFTFNGDDFDDDNSGRPGYGSHPAAQALMILKGAKQDNDGQDNAFGISTNQSVNGTGFGDGVSDNEYWGMSSFVYFNNNNSVTGDPRFAIDYRNYLQSKWRDNTHMVYGGSGHQNSPGATTTITNFMFLDTSDTYNYGTGGISMPAWNEVTASNAPNDRRGVASTGSVTFAPGDAIELTYAFVFGRDYVNTGAQAGVTNMLMRADSIRSYYNQGMLSPCGNPVSVNDVKSTNSTIKVYPNPVENQVNIRQQSASLLTITIIDATGKVMQTTTSNSLITTINLDGFANGLYLIKVSNNEVVEVKKVIKR